MKSYYFLLFVIILACSTEEDVNIPDPTQNQMPNTFAYNNGTSLLDDTITYAYFFHPYNYGSGQGNNFIEIILTHAPYDQFDPDRYDKLDSYLVITYEPEDLDSPLGTYSSDDKSLEDVEVFFDYTEYDFEDKFVAGEASGTLAINADNNNFSIELTVESTDGNNLSANYNGAVENIFDTQVLLTINQTEDTNSDKLYYILTNDNGLAGWVEITGQGTYKVTSPGNVGKENMDINLLNINGDKFDLLTYKGVNLDKLPTVGRIGKSGRLYTYTTKENQNGRTNANTATLTFTNVPAHEYASVSNLYPSDRIQMAEHIEEGETVTVNIYNDKIFIYLKDGTTGYYKMVEGLESDQTYNISLNDMSTEMDYYTSSYPENMILNQVHNFGLNLTGNLFEETLVYDINISDLDNPLFFHIPKDNEIFERYYYDINARVEDKYYSMSYLYTPSNFDPNFTLIDADISVSNWSINDLAVDVSGEFDYLRLFVGGDKGAWDIRSDKAQHFHFPNIPTEITTEYPWVSSNKLEDEVDLISAHELASINSYEEYYQLILAPPSEPEENSYSKSITVYN